MQEHSSEQATFCAVHSRHEGSLLLQVRFTRCSWKRGATSNEVPLRSLCGLCSSCTTYRLSCVCNVCVVCVCVCVAEEEGGGLNKLLIGKSRAADLKDYS